MKLPWMFFILAVLVSGCSSKKIVVKNCDKAANSDVYICDPL